MKKAQFSVEAVLVFSALTVSIIFLANYASSYAKTSESVSLSAYEKTILENAAVLSDAACARGEKLSFPIQCISGQNGGGQTIYLSGQPGNKLVVASSDLEKNFSITTNCAVTGTIPLSCQSFACFNAQGGSVLLQEGC
ncbi:hypothetical protein HY993_01450 [Candidatus Micrarchaeota archaeon]|nr:hypothetical protein [Candidatus Micrarchaeota archaeon]